MVEDVLSRIEDKGRGRGCTEYDRGYRAGVEGLLSKIEDARQGWRVYTVG